MQKQDIVNYLTQGCRDEDKGLHLDIDLDRFIIHPGTKEAVSYYGTSGVEAVLRDLVDVESRDDAGFVLREFHEEGHLVGYRTRDYSVTLKPAAQLTFSVHPVSDVFEYQGYYEFFQTRISRVLTPYGYDLAASGYQPASRVSDLQLIPGDRYRLMDQELLQVGQNGRRMMRGTAATRISFEYFSEEDFRRKYRIAYQLRTVLADLCDNLPVYEARNNPAPHLQLEIWHRVDPARTDVAPFLKNGTMDFDSYADFVLQAPVIVPCTQEEDPVVHALSMVFPDVRARRRLELRVADSMPLVGVLAFGIVVRTLFADPGQTEAFLRNSGNPGKELCGFVYTHCMPNEQIFLQAHYARFPGVHNLNRDVLKWKDGFLGQKSTKNRT